MAGTALTVRLRIDGVRDTLQALQALPKDANEELRERSMKLATVLAEQARADGMADAAPQSKLVATTVKARRDRVPVVEAGGTRRLGRHKTPAYGLLFASVFGMNRRSGWYAAPRYRGARGRQYRPHRGQDAYWFFPVIESQQARIAREWNEAASEIARKFGRGG
ncbi:hypothetical protein [Prauserella flavalba]|uniref:Phage protein, HK97 gp10 family n=1 Tax=Prauserella flavalba TaxID=1477506 RepID=A0A318L8W7_9PSEU|nr:hypothetical protein [Prauserella flavalba]PXY17346.1 hypothetical protein BA062_37690 [Prauserella flavalba]